MSGRSELKIPFSRFLIIYFITNIMSKLARPIFFAQKRHFSICVLFSWGLLNGSTLGQGKCILELYSGLFKELFLFGQKGVQLLNLALLLRYTFLQGMQFLSFGYKLLKHFFSVVDQGSRGRETIGVIVEGPRGFDFGDRGD